MKYLITIAILTISIGCNCQNLKVKKNQIGMGVTEFYNVYKSDKKTKVGESIIIFRTDTLAIGQYKDGYKTGTWRYFDRENKEEFTYDYSNSKVLGWKCKPNYQRCRMNGSAAYYTLGLFSAYADIVSNLKYPHESVDFGYTGSLVIIFIINPKGEIQDRKIEISSGHNDIDKAALKAAKNACNDLWIPAFDDKGNAVSDTITFKINFGN